MIAAWSKGDRTQRILRWWPELLLALTAMGALYLFGPHL
jgi:hypothetical protein